MPKQKIPKSLGLLWLYLFQFGLMALSLEPGFLDFDNLPDTNFTCVGKVIGGYYADLETNCQMFHVCTIGQADEPMDIRFLCLNGTVFDQETRVCERIDEVDCSKSEQYYSLNLELYGNSGPILEETPEVAQETEPPSIIIKSTTLATTRTTTSTKRPSNRPISSPYYTTNRPPTATTTPNQPHVISTHHFPVNAPDIRFNPEEINISLNPGAPPDIRTKHYLQQSFSDNSHEIVKDNLDSDNEHSVKVPKSERSRVSSTTSPKSIYNLESSDNEELSQNSEIDFGISGEGYQTELPRQQQFLIQTNSFRHRQSFPPNINHNANQYHHQHYHSTTAKQQNNFNQDLNPTTLRTIYLHSLKPPEIHQHHHFTHHHRTEKPPQRVQIPIPLLPTLPPLTFSSPAPFTLQRHVENKRYTKDHQVPPRIIISASASVSDASGKRLNYSLGTIGAGQILKTPPALYDDYKEGDVGLDPFYYDVPKLNQRRRKRRSTNNHEKLNPFDIIKNEKQAVDVLKFLFTWYQSHQATATVPSVTSPVSPDLIHKINYELAGEDIDSTFLTDSSEIHFTNTKEPASTESLTPKYRGKKLKQRGRFSMIGGYRNLHSKSENVNKDPINRQLDNFVNKSIGGKYEEEEIFESKNIPKVAELTEKMDDAKATVIKDLKEVYFNPYDYVDDNYEGVVYKETNPNNLNKNETLDLESGKKLENVPNIPKQDLNKSNSVDPNTVLQLYNYFNLNTNMPSSVKNTTDTLKEYNNLTINNKHHETDSINHKESKSSKNNIVLNNEITKIIKNSNPESTTNEDNSGKIDLLFNHTTTESNQYKSKSITFKDIKLGKAYTTLSENSSTQLEQYIIKAKNNTDHDSSIISTTVNYGLANYIEHDNVSEKNINNSRSLDDNKAKPYQEPVRFTEINVFSEVSQEEKNYQDILLSTTTSTTTRKTPVSRRRGRGRQRQYISFSDEQKNKQNLLDKFSQSNNSFGVNNWTPLNTDYNKNTDNAILKEQSNLSRAVGNRGRKRGRSRFTDYQTSTSTTTLSPTVKNKLTEESTEVSVTNNNATSNTANIKIKNDNIYTSTVNTIINNEENIKITNDSYTNIRNKTSDAEILGKVNNSSYKILDFYRENETDFRPSINTENNKETLATQTYVTEDSFTENHLLEEDTTHLKLLTNNTFTESADNNTITAKTNTKFPSETTGDPSYHVKLLRYFVNNAITPVMENITPRSPDVSYVPITENIAPGTEQTIPSTLNRHISKSINKNQERNRHQNRNNIEFSSELPTLRDIYTQTSDYDDFKDHDPKINHSLPTTFTSKTTIENKLPENNFSVPYEDPTTEFPSTLVYQKNDDLNKKVNLIKRLNFIEQNLAALDNERSVTDLPIADTTVTTPFVSFESPDSFGTTLPSTTNQALSDNLEESTESFDVTTQSIYSTLVKHTSKSNYNFYNDIFVVPEATEAENLKTKENTDKPLASTLDSSHSDNNYDKKAYVSSIAKYKKLDPKLTKTFFSESTTSHVTSTIYTTEIPFLPEEEKSKFEQIKKEEDYTTLLPDVEIQKSISLPILVLQSQYDNLNENNNAQDINDLASITSSSEIPDTVSNKETFQEFIQEIEVSTKSVVAKDDQNKLTYTEEYGITATETVPALEEIYEVSTLINKDDTSQHSVVTEVEHNATEMIFIKENEPSKTLENESTSHPLTSMPVDAVNQINSSHLVQVIVETTTTKPITTTLTTTNIPHFTRRTRPPKRKPYNSNRNLYGRHRFSTELFTNKPPIYEEAQYDKNQPTSHINTQNITDAPLYRSATPTRSELKKVALHTTPLSSKNSSFTLKPSKRYVFNCFGKEINKFYSDPRDCRLFHYCTQGYSKNQLLDLKFVCDQKTFFDENKLICTKVKPSRCL